VDAQLIAGNREVFTDAFASGGIRATRKLLRQPSVAQVDNDEQRRRQLNGLSSWNGRRALLPQVRAHRITCGCGVVQD